MKSKAVDRILNGFWTLLGIGICVESMRLKLWDPAGPGSGFIPFVTGLLIGAIGLVLLLSEWPGGSDQEGARRFWEDPVATKRVLYLLGSLCFVAIVMQRLGFLVTSFLVTAFMIRAIEPRRWMTVICVSLGSCFAIYFLFKYLMQINLPKGFLGF
jgi:putative tricarboxylic transport membrane protein